MELVFDGGSIDWINDGIVMCQEPGELCDTALG